MNIKINKKLLILAFIFTFIITSISTIVVGDNVSHELTCSLTKCPICALIQLANQYSESLKNVILFSFLLISYVPLIILIKKKIEKYKLETLIELKVIMNN